jgi:tetraacyldisaccharide 4'-kinase
MFRKKPRFFYKKNLICVFLLPFSWLYVLFFFVLNICFLKQKKICKKTICVGNVVVGGSGKTPICIAIYKELSKYFDRICFVSKGYKRSKKGKIVLPCGYKDVFSTNETGDEPKLLSDSADVFIINNRKEADCYDYDLAICDDGFFDKSIHKDCKIVVFDGNFFIGNGYTLPAGPLRCILSTVRKADFAIITNTDKQKINNQINILKKYIKEDCILSANLIVNSKHDTKKKYLAFSGIGENEKFFNSIKEYGLKLTYFIGFEDHCKYDEKTLNILREKFLSSKSDKILTTAKDFVKLPMDFCIQNNVEIFDICYKIKDIDKIISFVIKKNDEFNKES